MVRRILLLGMLGLAVFASPALASLQWNSAVKQGTATARRSSNGKCSFSLGSQAGWLRITCSAGGKATARYVFTSSRTITGTPTFRIDPSTGVIGHASIAGKSLTVKVSVSGRRSVQVQSVSVGYYTK